MAADATILAGHTAVPTVPKELERVPLVQNNRSIGWISDRICAITEGPHAGLVVGRVRRSVWACWRPVSG